MLIVEGKAIRNYQERMNNDELEEFCAANPELKVERDSDQNIVIMPPVGGSSGALENLLSFHLTQWAQNTYQKGIVFSSSTGFLLSNGAMRSPDAAWLSIAKWQQLDTLQKQKFVASAPEFVAEIQSPSDSPESLKTKMIEWIANGVQLGWLIDPTGETVSIYRPEVPVKHLKGFDQLLDASPVLDGFKLNLALLRLR